MYERCGMGACASGVECKVVEWVIRNTMRWFGHVERMKSEEFERKVCMNETGGPIGR